MFTKQRKKEQDASDVPMPVNAEEDAAVPARSKGGFMSYLWIAAVILVVLALVMNLLPGNSTEKKLPSGNCRNCPEFSSCGGGRPRCGRRAELKK